MRFNPRGWDTTPLGLGRDGVHRFPRVGARSSHQPWAEGHIPFGDGERLTLNPNGILSASPGLAGGTTAYPGKHVR